MFESERRKEQKIVADHRITPDHLSRSNHFLPRSTLLDTSSLLFALLAQRTTLTPAAPLYFITQVPPLLSPTLESVLAILYANFANTSI